MPGCLLCVFSFSNASVEFESSALYFDTVEENILGGGSLCNQILLAVFGNLKTI